MKKTLCALSAVAIAVLVGCSQESRDEAVDRVGRAAKALNGEVRADDKEHDTPNIVAEQQRKERIRQNRKWTAENRTKYPVEYCRAQLEELEARSKDLEVESTRVMTEQSRVQRKLGEGKAQTTQLSRFLEDAKAAYRKADAENAWPMEVNGFKMDKERAQSKIVEAKHKLDSIATDIERQNAYLPRLERKVAAITGQQKKIEELKTRLRNTIADLQVNNVTKGNSELGISLDALSDSLGALEKSSAAEPSLDDLAAPSPSATRDADFKAIMAQP